MTDKPPQDQRLEWPPPRDDPPDEPSHPGARWDEREERLATDEEISGDADT